MTIFLYFNGKQISEWLIFIEDIGKSTCTCRIELNISSQEVFLWKAAILKFFHSNVHGP